MIMKKKTIFLLSALLTVFAGCDDFLDTELLTQKTTDNFPGTEAEAQQMITAIYSQILFEDPETSSEFYAAQLASDDCLGGNLSYSNNCATNFLLYTGTVGSVQSALWNRCYVQIYRANNALATMDNVKTWSSETEKNRLLGEAYFLRALAYLELVHIYGPVPLRTSTEVTNLPRASVDEVFAQIGSDLRNAIDLIQNRIYLYGSPLTGHATKSAAQALMARAFLFYTGRYDKTEIPGVVGADGTEGAPITKSDVIGWIDDCVNNSGHNLLSDQRNMWAYSNDASESADATDRGFSYQYVLNNGLHWAGNSNIEEVFAAKHSLKSDWTYTWHSNTVSQFFSPSADNSPENERYPFGAGWGAGPVSPAMVSDWQKWASQQSYTDGYTTDPRIAGSIWSYKAMSPFTEGAEIFDRSLTEGEPPYTVSYRYYEQTGYFQKKYININAVIPNATDGSYALNAFGLYLYPGISSQTSDALLQIADLVYIRFADVLLMQSELKENADGLNRVRARSHLAPVAYSLDAIKNERRWELCFESVRWWDMLRWSGTSLEYAGNELNKQNNFTLINAGVVVPMKQYDYKTRLQKTQGYWPLPQSEIDLSNGVLEQNPGWDGSALFSDWEAM
jgi:hypothetical protein